MANSNADLIHDKGLKFVYLRIGEIVLHKIRDNLFFVIWGYFAYYVKYETKCSRNFAIFAKVFACWKPSPEV